MTDHQLFSAKLGRSISAGPPTDAVVSGVRDVIVCVKGDDTATGEEWTAHPPVGALDWTHGHPDPDNRVGTVELGREVRIEYLDREEAELVQVACQPRGHYFFPIGAPNQVYSFVRRMPASEHDEYPFRWDPDGVLDDALVLSRLVRDNGFSKQYAARITDYEDGEQQVMYLPWAEDAIIWRLRRDREYLDGPEAEELGRLLTAYWEIGDEMPERVSRAMWRMAYAPRIRWADLILPFLVSGLEALLKVGRTELTRQFKRRATSLASDLSIEGVDEAFCERMYDGRSDWVHGSRVSLVAPPTPSGVEDGAEGPVGEAQVNVLAEIALLQDLLRKAVRRCIEDADYRAIFVADEAIQQHWPV